MQYTGPVKAYIIEIWKYVIKKICISVQMNFFHPWTGNIENSDENTQESK